MDYCPPPHQGLSIVYEDEFLLVLDKPSGLLSVPGRGDHKSDCLASRVQQEYPNARTVHRLDLSTSGLIMMALGTKMHRALSILFQDRKVHKRYQAVVAGHPENEQGSVNLPLIVDWPNRPRQKVDFETGRPSLTNYRVLGHEGPNSRMELEPVTGRSHQLRVHMCELGHPILGDDLYGGERSAVEQNPRLLLHACRLELPHPVSGRTLAVESPPPF